MPPSCSPLRAGCLLFAAIAAILACRGPFAPTAERASSGSDDAATAAAFFQQPILSHVCLSPDGKRLAGIASRDGVRVLIEKPIRGGEVGYLSKFDERRGAVRTVGWSGRDAILVGVDVPRSSGRSAAHSIRMSGVQINRWRPRVLGRSWTYPTHPELRDGILHWPSEDPEHILVNWWESEEVGASVRRVRVRDGIAQDVVPAKPGVTTWFADRQGRVRAASGISLEGMTHPIVYARAGSDDRFERLVDTDLFQESYLEFAGFSEDPKMLYVYSSTESGRLGLFEYDLERNAVGQLVYAHPEVDVGALVYSPTEDRLWAVAVDPERPGLHFVDPAAQREQASIDAAFPGAINRMLTFDRKGNTAIVRVSSDTTPPQYYVYDRAKKTMDLLFTANLGLDPRRLAPMKPVHYTARDGVVIPGYLTVPRAMEPVDLPVIVVPHDGPSGRDSWGWDPLVQFLASRGFAVLQPNFRGSSGYGREHERKGYRQWGLAMQDDITDAVHWLAEQGIADPDRVGIYGVGYGGYAALWGLVSTPELFRAGASFAAVTDLIDLLENPAHYRSSDFNQPVFGETSRDREQLEATSPALHADRIRAPVLIAHGAEDPIVHVDQARAMIAALEAAGASVETLLYRDEAHELRNEDNRIDFYEKLASFFERHLAAREGPS